MPTEVEIAWAAGLFEGEGCISIVNRRRVDRLKRGVSMSVTSTDRDVLERFAAIMGVGKVASAGERTRPSHHKPQFRWQVASAREVERMLALLMPHLAERRTQKAIEALEVAATIASTRGPAKSALCKRGHILIGDNAKTSNGKRQCRECVNAWRRKFEKKKVTCG